jgi:hypothetical protein
MVPPDRGDAAQQAIEGGLGTACSQADAVPAAESVPRSAARAIPRLRIEC